MPFWWKDKRKDDGKVKRDAEAKKEEGNRKERENVLESLLSVFQKVVSWVDLLDTMYARVNLSPLCTTL